MRRSTVIRSSTALRVALLAGSALALQMQELVVAVGLAVITVAVGTPAYPAAAAAMPSLAGRRSSQLTSFLVTAEVSAFVVGPALGGLLVGVGGQEWAIPVSAVITLLALVLLARVRTGPIARVVVPADRGRIRTVLQCRGVPLVISVVVVINLVVSAASIGYCRSARVRGAVENAASGSLPRPSASARLRRRYFRRCSDCVARCWPVAPDWR